MPQKTPLAPTLRPEAIEDEVTPNRMRLYVEMPVGFGRWGER